jgi:AcrR family transcriptional regulator
MTPSGPAAVITDHYHHGDLRYALINAALSLLTEKQDWEFSLREVARRAGVSHNAPYNHFASKRDLLAAVALAGHELLRTRMIASVAGIKDAEAAMIKIALVYVKFGLDNPAHYRLMFSTELSKGGRPIAVVDAGKQTRKVLEDAIRRGARSGVFTASLMKNDALQVAVIATWAAMHGLTMLALDGVPAVSNRAVEQLADKVARIISRGLLR